MFGWSGKILKVDLSSGRVRREDIPPEILHGYIGGRGLGVRLLRDHFSLYPFDPGMPLIFSVGPLCGTGAPCSATLSIVSRSPLTGTVTDSSCTGIFPLMLKGAGIDVLYLEGAAKAPTVLVVDGENSELVPAAILWGKDVRETVGALSSKGSVAAIGSAGENRVLFAGIVIDKDGSSTRGGLGAVMGAKHLKAIVVRGKHKPKVAEPGRFNSAVSDIMRLFRASPLLFGTYGFINYGDAALVDLINQRLMTPTENFRKTCFPESTLYSGPALKRIYSPQESACQDCPVKCRKTTLRGEYVPSYDVLSHFGALNCISDPKTIFDSAAACHKLGLESISAAATLASWGELRGSFPDGDEIQRLLHDIAARRCDGEILSLGSRRAMTELGAPELSMAVKSLELPAYDPRGAYGLALAYCTNNRGGCHMAALPISHEILRKPVPTDRLSFAGKGRINRIVEDAIAAMDSISVCRYSFFAASLEEFSELLTAATGMEYTSRSIAEIGERIFLTERFYNVANGFSKAEDCLPDRFHSEAGSDSHGMGIPPIDRRAFHDELQRYYRIRGLRPDGTFADDSFLREQP